MKKTSVIISLLASALFLAGCGQKNEAAAPAANAAPSGSFDLTANDTMKYNITRLEVTPGQDVTVTLTNMGNMPKAAMAHNFVLLKKGTDLAAFTNAAVQASATDYIPASLAGEIIVHTKLLGPKESDEVKFKAPTEPGEYPFLCSFPAHYLSGMHGVLVVK